MQLALNELIFGKTDAFNELKECGEDWFIRAFFLMRNMILIALLKEKAITYAAKKELEKQLC